jgi:hypothetical protein
MKKLGIVSLLLFSIAGTAIAQTHKENDRTKEVNRPDFGDASTVALEAGCREKTSESPGGGKETTKECGISV